MVVDIPILCPSCSPLASQYLGTLYTADHDQLLMSNAYSPLIVQNQPPHPSYLAPQAQLHRPMPIQPGRVPDDVPRDARYERIQGLLRPVEHFNAAHIGMEGRAGLNPHHGYDVGSPQPSHTHSNPSWNLVHGTEENGSLPPGLGGSVLDTTITSGDKVDREAPDSLESPAAERWSNHGEVEVRPDGGELDVQDAVSAGSMGEWLMQPGKGGRGSPKAREPSTLSNQIVGCEVSNARSPSTTRATMGSEHSAKSVLRSDGNGGEPSPPDLKTSKGKPVSMEEIVDVDDG